MPEKAKRMGDGMDPITSRRLWIYSALYCGFVLLIHIAGGSNYLHQVEGRQGVIIETLRTSPRLALQFAGHAVAIIVLNLLPLALLLLSLRCSAPVRVRLAASAFTQFLVAVVCLWLVILCFNKLYFPRCNRPADGTYRGNPMMSRISEAARRLAGGRRGLWPLQKGGGSAHRAGIRRD